MNSNEWLQELKAGDTVIVSTGQINNIMKVKRLTPSQVIVGINDYEQRFHKKDGREVGGVGFHSEFLKQATPEYLAELRAESTRRKLRRTLYGLDRATTDALSDDQLQRIYAILAEGKE